MQTFGADFMWSRNFFASNGLHILAWVLCCIGKYQGMHCSAVFMWLSAYSNRHSSLQWFCEYALCNLSFFSSLKEWYSIYNMEVNSRMWWINLSSDFKLIFYQMLGTSFSFKTIPALMSSNKDRSWFINLHIDWALWGWMVDYMFFLVEYHS